MKQRLKAFSIMSDAPLNAPTNKEERVRACNLAFWAERSEQCRFCISIEIRMGIMS